MSTAPAITASGLTKRYGPLTAVDALDLTVPTGQILAFLGPNGAGKSTTTEMVLGLTRPDAGSVEVFGADPVTAMRGGDVGAMLQNGTLLADTNVRSLIRLMHGLHTHPLPLDEVIERADLSPILKTSTNKLSGGQAQRVAVGRAIVKKPDVFLFDEPLSNLDAKLRASMRIRISDLHKQLKKSGKPATTVYVTHDQTEAMTMGDRICVMKLGHIMQVDTPDNLYHQPKNMFVAGFIGAPEMNIRPSQLVEHGGRLHLTLGDQRLPLNDRLQSKVETHKNQQVFFGVRPEFVSLSDEPFAEGSCTGEMVRVENMGHEFFVYLKVADYELTARVPSDEAKPMIEKGLHRKVYFKFDLNKCHIFDAKTEQNLSL